MEEKIPIETEEDLHKETARRKDKMKIEMCKPVNHRKFENQLTINGEKKAYKGMLIQKNISFSSLCEHHEVAIVGTVSVGVIADKYLIGLSKLGRVVEKYLNSCLPTLQERATMQILDELKRVYEPKGIIVIISAKHHCICHRGIKKDSETVTSEIDGVFEKQEARNEFLMLLKGV